MSAACNGCCSRRDFLLAGALAVTMLPLPGTAADWPEGARLLQARYPRRRIGRLAALADGEPLYFDYPQAGIANLLVKLGVPAGGGVGPARDVVAFNLRCTHMGGDLAHTLQARHRLLGPCPRHLSTFDLTRHGLVVTGSATASLPQIVLELAGDAIDAVGIMGVVYGHLDTGASA